MRQCFDGGVCCSTVYRKKVEAFSSDLLKRGKCYVVYIKSFFACMVYIIKHNCDEFVAAL